MHQLMGSMLGAFRYSMLLALGGTTVRTLSEDTSQAPPRKARQLGQS
jgi:hypothetical protein